MSTYVPPRTLTDLEVGVVRKLLSSEVTGASEYLTQVPHARVVATWGVGSPSVDLEVESGPEPASASMDGIFASGDVSDRGGRPVGEVILWVEAGWLSGIEYAWYTDERPHSLPDPSRIRLR
ncbi:hypothetical protein [Nocardia cyriacigeorgica]|uniref:hypothetical protein n=1 Tax=Nocardia cyriacigeorgica TaxID=135487 RepID=UPI0018959DC2|nr:hypothetical protein [Nocardia cyriacigeorgica]MBF6287450.1 hypothetical protein [Nocardia cyriacigeorgica]